MSNHNDQGLADYFRLVSETLKRIDKESANGNGSSSVQLSELRHVIVCSQGPTILKTIFDAQTKVDAAIAKLESRETELVDLQRTLEPQRRALEQERHALEQEKLDFHNQKEAFLEAQAISTETRDAIKKTASALSEIMESQKKAETVLSDIKTAQDGVKSDLRTLLRANVNSSLAYEAGPAQKRARTQEDFTTDSELRRAKPLQERQLDRLADLAGSEVVVEGEPQHYKTNIATALQIFHEIHTKADWRALFHYFQRGDFSGSYCLYALLGSEAGRLEDLENDCRCPRDIWPWSTERIGVCIQIAKMEAKPYAKIELLFDVAKKGYRPRLI